jgi:GNAT superfamily N-acetyltransferase
MASTSTAFSIRPVESGQLLAWLALVNQSRYWQEDEAGLRFSDTLRPPAEPFLRIGAWAADGSLAGVAEAALSEDGGRLKDRAQGLVAVASAYRRQGLGTQLAEKVEGFARANHVRWLETDARAKNIAATAPFLAARGFNELERYRTSIQEPATVDLSRLDELRRRLDRTGIRTTAYLSIDSPAAREELYRATMPIWRDMPHESHVDWQDPPLGTFLRSIFERPSVLLDSLFVALDGGQIVGQSYLMRRPDGDAEVGDTGVLQSHRRRGIARVLKMMVTRYAAERGIQRIHTDNRADNEGMLAINRELGFVPGEEIVIFEKTLTSERADAAAGSRTAI